MLTRRGLGVAVGALVLMVSGRLLGTVELYVLAAGGLALCALAWLTVWLAAFGVDVERVISPTRAHAGSDTLVALTVVNRSRRRTPPIWLADSVGPPTTGDGQLAGRGIDRGGIRPPRVNRPVKFQIAPLHPGESVESAYRMPTSRGLFTVGPAQLWLTDPFGLASRRRHAGTAADLTVYPRIDRVTAPPRVARDPRGGSDTRATVGSGDELYGLRPYQIGDDLRRVHWPSTARQNDLMIRQPEQPWQGRATILVDTRRPRTDDSRVGDNFGEAFEILVSAAASVVIECWKHDAQVRLVTTSGFDSGSGSGPRHLDAILEHLAVVDVDSDRSPASVSGLARQPGGALVTLTCAAPGANDLTNITNLAQVAARFGWDALVLAGAAARGATKPPTARTSVIRVDGQHPFAAGWNRAVRPARVGRG